MVVAILGEIKPAEQESDAQNWAFGRLNRH